MNVKDSQTAVILLNIGSPATPDPEDVKQYLKQFLMDPYVIDYPWILRALLVYGLILPTRPQKVAKAYESIWSGESFPLISITESVVEKLSKKLNQPVEMGMRYGQPSIASAIERIATQFPGVNKIKLVPMFPHFAMATFGGIRLYVEKILKSYPQFEHECIDPFYDHPDYIQALVTESKKYISTETEYVLFSYHGLPERQIKKGDPTNACCLILDSCCETGSASIRKTCYRSHTRATTRLVAKSLGLSKKQYSESYQSRLGKDKWLEPYTDMELIRLAKAGVKHLTVLTPAFVTDCLETLEEINEEGREIFLSHGGESFTFVPCLNDSEAWINTLQKLVTQ